VKKYPLIVIYGAPNLGKTVQSKMLSRALNGFYIKYPVYDLSPTGPLINTALRETSNITTLELQTLCAQNRRDFEPALKALLKKRPVIAEAYTQTGIISGVFEGESEKTLKELNAGLLSEDFAILLDGERFTEAIEKNHRFEANNWEKTRALHKKFGRKLGWKRVNANQPKEKVHQDIMSLVNVYTMP